ncbi:MAG: nucleotidyltransferase family protein [Gammaproteobacteria bacterium]
MKAMILAAGLGTRLRPLTQTVPKPLIPVKGKPLIVYHLERCRAAGITEVVINVSYLGHQIEAYLADGSAWGLTIRYSREPEPLDVAGGIRHALPLLGKEPFWCLSADVYTDLDLFSRPIGSCLPQGIWAHLILVPNPEHHPDGDFGYPASAVGDVCVLTNTSPCMTYAGMAFIDPQLLVECAPADRRVGSVFRAGIERGAVQGECYHGQWSDVGTPMRLAEIER